MMKVRCYDPHPGITGPVISLPKALKSLADTLNNQVIELSTALDLIKYITDSLNGRVKAEAGMILVTIKDDSGRTHSWRLLRIEEIKE